jgi:hypothetical protein
MGFFEVRFQALAPIKMGVGLRAIHSPQQVSILPAAIAPKQPLRRPVSNSGYHYRCEDQTR